MKQTLAILDSDPIGFSLISGYLKESFECKHYSTADELIKNFDTDKCTVIACDAFNSGVEGRKICSQIGTVFSIIFLSSMTKDEERRSCFLDDKHQYMTKPYSGNDLIDAVEVSLHRNQLAA